MTQVTEDQFRQLMGRFATGVTVVTSADSDGRHAGMTASAVAAVSLDPPLILVCVNSRDPLHSVMRSAVAFALNVLASDQEQTSRQFADRSADRFARVDYSSGPNGVRLLRGVLAHIVCEPWKALEAGDHTVFIGRVIQGAVFDGKPLLHYKGAYATAADSE